MSIPKGTRLGSYEILSLLGAGGMGEVYKARDTRLDRIVAIKVLAAHLASKPELRERFEREAKTIASLKHPHICLLYHIANENGADYLVMEYLEGETLAARLKKGPVPLDEVLRYATEISDALDKAHRNGVTHRDLKPGNVMLVKEGSVYSTKLLDFGLAKLKQETAKEFVLDSQAPTPPLGDHLTQQGEILGTLQYMAPEQVEGKNDEIDARTDIFAFGALVYEMATGKKAFEGKTRPSMMASILKEDPPSMSTLQPMTPVALDRVVKKCLAKEQDKRWQSAGDLNDALQWLKDGSLQAAPPVTASPKQKSWTRAAAWGLAGLVVAALAAVGIWSLRTAPISRPVVRLLVTLPPNESLRNTTASIAISPDGSRLVYVANGPGNFQLYQRDLDSLESKPIPGTEGAGGPFFSPDGQWVSFFAGGTQLKKVFLNGGSPVTICANTAQTRGASWGANDVIVFGTSGALRQVPAAGGTPKPLTEIKNVSESWPEFLPGGKAILFVALSGQSGENGDIVAERLDTGERHVLIQGASYPRYASSGHVVFYRGGTVMAVPFDVNKLEVKGAPVPVLEGVLSGTQGLGAADFSFSTNGTLVYLRGTGLGNQRTLAWVDRKGVPQPLAAPAHAYEAPRLSPDGGKVTFTVQDPQSDVWIYDLSRGTLTRLTFEGNSAYPRWTPDGKRIIYTSNKGGALNMFWKPADGTGTEEQLTNKEHFFRPASLTPDGKTGIYSENDPKNGKDLWTISMEGERKTSPFLQTPFDETAPLLSPDGRWVSYVSNESGRNEIYVRPFPGPGGKWQISTEGGEAEVWARSGRELFYQNGDKMMSVEITTQPTFAAGTPKLLFEGRFQKQPGPGPNYDVSLDGQRFLMLKAADQASTSGQINVVLNWFEELKKKVPVK